MADSTAVKPISQLKSVDDLCAKLEEVRKFRQPLERQWRLNLAFYKGKQYAFYPPNSNRLEYLATEEGRKPRHRVRLVSNQIMPGTATLLAQLTKTKPQMFATPGSGSENEVRAAQMAQSLLEHWWIDLNLDEKLDEALLWSIIASAGYWRIRWDDYASKQMRFTIGPDGRPIVDEALKQEFISQLRAVGMEPQEQVVYMGDVAVDVLSPFDVYLDHSAKVIEDCKFVICRHSLDPDEIKTRWGVSVEPDAVPSEPDITLPFGNSQEAVNRTVRNVFVGYFKPTASLPNGRYVVWTEGNDRKILEDTKWNLPINQLPIVKFAGMRVPGSVYDDAVVTHAVPLQKELNRTISQIVEYKNMTINPVMTAPIGSLRTQRTTEPGQVLEYQPISVGGGMAKPEFENLPTLPPYVFEHLRDVQNRLSDVFLSAEVINGKVPPNVEAGVAIDLLQEMATDKLAPIIKLIEGSIAKAGQLMLVLAQKYYVDPRLLKIRGSGGGVQVRKFKQADIAGNISVHAEVGSGLPRTRAGRQARIERFIELGIINPSDAYKYIDLADLRGLQAQMAADESLAYRNIDKLLAGYPINPEAAEQALQAINMGINPMTQEPISDPAEIEVILMNAALTPQPGIDHQAHISITGLFMKGVEFEALSPDVRKAFFTYYDNLQQAVNANAPTPRPEAPRVNLQIKSTAGPSTQAKILQQAGVPVTQEDTTEPPLETWVSDSVDKPDTDATGPGQEANQLSEAAMAALQVQIADAQAKQQAVIKQQQHDLDQTARSRSEERADELHSQQLRKLSAEADLVERRAGETGNGEA